MTMHGRAPQYIDGELTAEEEIKFLDHLVCCPVCESELGDELQLRDREASLSHTGSRNRQKDHVAGHKSGFRGLAVIASVWGGAACVVLLAATSGTVPAGSSPSLNVVVEAGPTDRQGMSAHGRHRLLVSATPAATGVHEVRIYWGRHELLLRCPGDVEPACRGHGRNIDSSLTLAAPGEYQVLLLQSSKPLPAATGDREADLRFLRESGGRVVDLKTIAVY